MTKTASVIPRKVGITSTRRRRKYVITVPVVLLGTIRRLQARGGLRRPLIVVRPIANLGGADAELRRAVAHRPHQLLLLLRVDPPQRRDVAIVAHARQIAVGMAELVPVRDALERCSPFEDIVMKVRQD